MQGRQVRGGQALLCDARRDWAAEAPDTDEADSLLTVHGGFVALTQNEFMQAFRAAGGRAGSSRCT